MFAQNHAVMENTTFEFPVTTTVIPELIARFKAPEQELQMLCAHPEYEENLTEIVGSPCPHESVSYCVESKIPGLWLYYRQTRGVTDMREVAKHLFSGESNSSREKVNLSQYYHVDDHQTLEICDKKPHIRPNVILKSNELERGVTLATIKFKKELEGGSLKKTLEVDITVNLYSGKNMMRTVSSDVFMFILELTAEAKRLYEVENV